MNNVYADVVVIVVAVAVVVVVVVVVVFLPSPWFRAVETSDYFTIIFLYQKDTRANPNA